MIELRHERMNDQFEKFHVIGLPFDCALHHFTGPDTGDFHDHPFDFTSHILAGGYVEEMVQIAHLGATFFNQVERRPGTSHRVNAEHTHRIIRLLEPECWTLILPGPHIRVTRFWRFEGSRVLSRAWNEAEFTVEGE
jgi:hypothetical protein